MISEAQLHYLVQRGNDYCGEAQPRYDEALMCYETALKLALAEQQKQIDKTKRNARSSNYDYNKVDTLDECIGVILSNKGSVHLKLRELDLACRCFTFSLKIKQVCLHPTHPDVTGMMHNVGICLQNMSRWEEARQVYQECLMLKKQNWVDNAVHVPSTLVNLGLVEHSLGKVITAQKTLKEAIDCGRRLLGSDHAEVSSALTHLGKIKLEVGEYNEALRCFNDVIFILQRNFLNEAYIGPAIEVLNGLVRETLNEMESDGDDDDYDYDDESSGAVSVDSGEEGDDEFEQLVLVAARVTHHDDRAIMDGGRDASAQAGDKLSTLDDDDESSVPDLKHLLTGPTVYLSASGYDFTDTERFLKEGEFNWYYRGY